MPRKVPFPVGLFVFRVDRLANLFHFVNNMAAWHFACSESYNRAWLAETGELTEDERAALDAFAAVVREFSYGDDRWMGKAFITAETPDAAWEQARSLVGPEKVSVVQSVFEALSPRFARIWESDEPRLRALPERLRKAIASPGVGTAIRALEDFYDTPFPALTVHLLISRGKQLSAGGANEGPGHVTLEVLETENLMEGIEVLLHEGSHLMQARRLEPLFDEFSRVHGLDTSGDGLGNARHLFHEALTGSLVPGGCLSWKLGRQPHDHLARAERARARGAEAHAALEELTARFLPLVATYIDQGRPVDGKLLENIYAAYAAAPPKF